MKVFLEEIRKCPNHLQVLPEEKLEILQALTKETHELMGKHPIFKLEEAKKLQAQIKKDLESTIQEQNKMRSQLLEGLEDELGEEEFKLFKELPLSQLSFDCGGMLKMIEKQTSALKSCLAEIDKVIRFQENPNTPLSDEIKFPLIEVSISMQKILESGLFQ